MPPVHITDAEFKESALNREKMYRDELKRGVVDPADPNVDKDNLTYMDALGRGRWPIDYYAARLAGLSHGQAMQRERWEIRNAAGLPQPEPKIEYPVPTTPAPQPPTPTTPPTGTTQTAEQGLARIHAVRAQATAEQPDALTINTKATCYTLLKRLLQLAGPEFAFVGKTANMDGSGKYTPPGFVHQTRALRRDDGEEQMVVIAAVSMDACWHLPSKRQIKVIVNSTDGEIAEGGHGQPARLDSYLIPEFGPDGQRQYRWHNPPVLQTQVP